MELAWAFSLSGFGEAIVVKDWRIALFDHRLPHEGKPVDHGSKLVLRNDIVASAAASLEG